MAARLPTGRIVERYPREYFVNEVWDYRQGDAVTILVPYGGGKTKLGFQLLERSMTPETPALILVMKSEDTEVSAFQERNKLSIVRDWPPARRRLVDRIRGRKPRGYVLWPAETANLDLDDLRHAAIFRRALQAQYRNGHNITFADETYSLEQEYKLTKDINRILTKGRSKGAGLWSLSQRPVYITKWAYQAQHLFLGFDPSKDAQERFVEIGGGVDPDVVRETVRNLGRWEFAYLNRDDRTMCIVEA